MTVGLARDNWVMVKIGYARVSTLDQHPRTQVEALTVAGCEQVFTDHGVSGTKASRPELDRCLAYLRQGDQLVAWKLDRLGRSVSHLVRVVEDLRRRGVQFTSLTEQLDTTTPAGRLSTRAIARPRRQPSTAASPGWMPPASGPARPPSRRRRLLLPARPGS
jgi:hypothetical protein